MSISYEAPRNDARRLQTLNQVITVAAQDAAAGRVYIRADVLAEAQRLQPLMTAALDGLSGALAGRMQKVNAKDEAFRYLEWGVRDAWESIKRRARRQNLGTAVLAYYGLPASGEVPGGTSQPDLLQYSQEVLDGDGEAVAAGFAPLKDPDALELQALRDAAQAAYDALPMADRGYDLAQTAVSDLRAPLDETLADVVRDMRYNLSIAKMDKEDERRVMRSYGFIFTTEAATPEETVNETLADVSA